MIISFLIKIIKKIIDSIAKHPKAALGIGIGVGAAAGVAGAGAAIDAKKINKKALLIQQEALVLHEAEYSKVQQTLTVLGKTEKNVIDSFPAFADTMEKIKGRPKMRTNIFSTVNLPNYQPEELKCLANDVQIAIMGAGGAGAGALVGLAAFGASAIIAAPAAVAFGGVVCVKGFGMRKKAIENVRQAKKMRKSVDEIVAFYKKLDEASKAFHDSISAVFDKYQECMSRVNATVAEKETWKAFTREERQNTENTVMLARLLYAMCQTNVVVKADSEKDKIETVNEAELCKLEKQSKKLLTAM